MSRLAEVALQMTGKSLAARGQVDHPEATMLDDTASQFPDPPGTLTKHFCGVHPPRRDV